ncbi:MAG: hypothetical protein EAZ09_14535 [Oscillatoriales cyanobacterium]|nr:MAG: hypothetical protein EAZ18_13265 [Oscillatoriales cyanobacterium]TAH20317.1 MAG: hypothetical protein EAZ09_14535 [Oscillatoriales cyanobacterium]
MILCNGEEKFLRSRAIDRLPPAKSHPTEGGEPQASRAITLLYRIVKDLGKKYLNGRKPVLYFRLRIKTIPYIKHSQISKKL